MPKLIHALPKYALNKRSGQARVKYNGKVTYLGPYGSPESKQAYTEFLDNLAKSEPVKKLEPIEPVRGPTLLLGEVVLRFYQHAQTYYARPNGEPTGEAETIRCCLRFLTDQFRDLPVTQFGPKKLKDVQAHMIALGKSRRYINKATGVIRRCFRWAASEELLSGQIAVELGTVQGLQEGRTAAREKPKVGPVSDEHVDAVPPYVSRLVADVVQVMRRTGARPGEILGMTAAEIDRSDPDLWVYRPALHKNTHRGKDRVVFIGAKAQEVIKRRMLKCGPGGRLFPMNRTTLRDLIYRGCKKAGIPNWHPIRLRHSYATKVRATDGIEGAQVLLGHAKADVTQIYAERNERLAADIARKIG
jgi:integrase